MKPEDMIHGAFKFAIGCAVVSFVLTIVLLILG
jgi:hypothetical protein